MTGTGRTATFTAPCPCGEEATYRATEWGQPTIDCPNCAPNQPPQHPTVPVPADGDLAAHAAWVNNLIALSTRTGGTP